MSGSPVTFQTQEDGTAPRSKSGGTAKVGAKKKKVWQQRPAEPKTVTEMLQRVQSYVTGMTTTLYMLTIGSIDEDEELTAKVVGNEFGSGSWLAGDRTGYRQAEARMMQLVDARVQ